MAKRKKKGKAKKKLSRQPMAKEEEAFYVGVNEPRMLRRTILESTRDAIQSLQQFEQFNVVRKEKHDMVVHLKSDIQELRSFIGKLKKALPKTNLRVKLHKEHMPVVCQTCQATFARPEELVKHVKMHKPKGVKIKKAPKRVAPTPKLKPKTGLERLESELDSIESQLTRLS